MTTFSSPRLRVALSGTVRLIAGVALALGSVLAWAQSAPQASPNFLALGAAVVPDFPGSWDRQTVPALIGHISVGSTSVRFLGNSAQWNLLPADSPWALGPVLSLRSARDEDVEDAVVKRLRPVDATAGAGVFAEYSWRNIAGSGDSLTSGVELLGGKTGAHAQVSLDYRWQALPGLRLSAGGHVGVASSKYQRTYFDVDADNRRRSGLPQYSGKNGTSELGLALGGTYDLSGPWLLIGRLQFARLTGDAADSPIVTLRGSRNQNTFVLAVGRSF